jgi:hypothetical protein
MLPIPLRHPLFSRLHLATLALAALVGGCSNHDDTSTGGADLTVKALAAADVATVKATVTGPALSAPRVVSLTAHDVQTWGATLGGLPVGSNYVFSVSATDAAQNQLYTGAATGITIVKGHNTAVVITAQQYSVPNPFKNGLPVIDSLLVSSTAITPGETVTAKVTAHDPDGDALTFAWSASPATDGFSAPSAATTTWTAPASDGDVTVTITVKDSHGAASSASVLAHVANANGHGQVTVDVTLNTWPVVSDIVVAPGYINLGQPVSLTVVASDADKDPLSYAWTSTCATGTFSAPTAAASSFTLPADALDAVCEFDVTVQDNRGGSTHGQVTLAVGTPPTLAAPVVTDTLQSAAVVEPGSSATLSLTATDPQAKPLSFAWLASAGTLAGQVDDAGSSQIIWTAPATGGASFTVSAVVTDTLGMSTQVDFALKTAALASTCTPPASSPWKFGVMSDTQWIGTDDGKDPNSVAVDIVNQLNAQFIAQGVKMVVQVGDLTDSGSNVALQTTALFRQALYNANIGFFPLRGNHESSLAGANEFRRVFPQTQTGAMNATPSDVFTTLIGHVDDAFTAPVLPSSSASFTMGTSFTSPSAGTAGLSYAFDYNNVRFVLLDQFISFDGTASASGNYNLDPQLPWLATALAGKPAGGHAFVFGHKGLITENHVDTLFGSDPSKDPAGQDTFINALVGNGVHFYMGGHDHIHNRALVSTTDGVTARVQNIVAASDSSKFYIPAIPSVDQSKDVPAFGHTRETQIAQERNTVGYYVFTVDGAQVSVDFYSAVVNPTLASGEYLISASLPMTFTKRETFGYGLGGQEYLVPEAGAYTAVKGSYAGTTATVLAGGNASTAIDGSNRALSHLVDLAWAPATCATASAILTLWGTADLGAPSGDTIALALTFDPSLVSDATLVSGHFGLASPDATGHWVGTTTQNVGGTPAFVLGPWNSSYPLGTHGIDLVTNTAWAVINHAGRMAVAAF